MQRPDQRVLVHLVHGRRLALLLVLLPRLQRRRLLLLLLRGCPFGAAAGAPAAHIPGQGIDVAVLVSPHHVLSGGVLVIAACRCRGAILGRRGALRPNGGCIDSRLRCTRRRKAGGLWAAGSRRRALRLAAAGEATRGGLLCQERRLVGVQPGGLLHGVVVALRQGRGAGRSVSQHATRHGGRRERAPASRCTWDTHLRNHCPAPAQPAPHPHLVGAAGVSRTPWRRARRARLLHLGLQQILNARAMTQRRRGLAGCRPRQRFLRRLLLHQQCLRGCCLLCLPRRHLGRRHSRYSCKRGGLRLGVQVAVAAA